MKCPVCGEKYNKLDYQMLARHLGQLCERNDSPRVDFVKYYAPGSNWLSNEFQNDVKQIFAHEKGHLGDWILSRFVQRIFGEKPHPFIESMQKPKKSVFQGYAIEYMAFHKQRIRSFAFAMAKSDKIDIQKLEAKLIFPELMEWSENITSQESLLEAMAESVGIPVETLSSSMPLPPTLHATRLWNSISENDSWLEIVTSHNLLDLVYSPLLGKSGAKLPYFGPFVLENEWIPDEVKTFLSHSVKTLAPIAEKALEYVVKYGEELGVSEDIQSVFLRSLEAFDRHLLARVTRARQFDSK